MYVVGLVQHGGMAASRVRQHQPVGKATIRKDEPRPVRRPACSLKVVAGLDQAAREATSGGLLVHDGRTHVSFTLCRKQKVRARRRPIWLKIGSSVLDQHV